MCILYYYDALIRVISIWLQSCGRLIFSSLFGIIVCVTHNERNIIIKQTKKKNYVRQRQNGGEKRGLSIYMEIRETDRTRADELRGSVYKQFSFFFRT